MEYEFLPIKTDKASIDEIVALLQITFPESNKFTYAYIEWQYKNNPDGEVVGYNAYDSGKLIAHYALMPFKATVFDKEELGLLSLNTATHPAYQGKGLFVKLAEMSYELARHNGYGFVIGVANANSSYGFIYKLNFQKIGELEARIGFGALKRLKDEENKVNYYKREWSDASLRWRLNNPSCNYKVTEDFIFSMTSVFFIKAILFEKYGGFLFHKKETEMKLRKLNLWIGIDNSIDWKASNYFEIPKRLRPSPLNLIFKDLTVNNRKLELNTVLFNALDFDAY
ncbi:GNAT family N-acetyltransferase [Flavobacterium lacisediminis]|uniref:GNAT family N-acetyltransferase n=1 Tax=Flavobacterium lacisediminis TaxID=2989705 RepID=A0ABT3EJU5_9FLAO|nr:GNAT family N-acetyltransferase [Flavobacterium lacisediminis]MCW1148825.1 GNAT family N-acetyltransferase [Flavobacterium lacisediminis]